MSNSDVKWCRRLMAVLAEGGVWAVPRSGLVFQKRGDALKLVDRMPWDEELRLAHGRGKDVPASAAALRAYQDEDFECIKRNFAKAGIKVERDG